MNRLILFLLVAGIFSNCTGENTQVESESGQRVFTGAEMLLTDHLPELEDKRVGLVMNPTARIGEVHMLDTLLALDVNVTALFAPEHGFRGEAGAGEKIEDGEDLETGLPVHSLYGDTRKPTPEMLENIDLLIFDMQDVGARFYTYHATMGLVLEGAADAGVPVWILDRPNPAGGDYVSGWVRDDEFISFVGPYPIPIAHGLTLGELAGMMIGEQWLDVESQPELKIIRMQGWNRDMKWPETGLKWVPPSPNLPNFEHAYLYLGTVLFEGTTLSEGRGTENPFLTLGDPSTDLSEEDIENLRSLTDALIISEATFTPVSMPGAAPNPKHQDIESYGISIQMQSTDFDPVRTGISILQILYNATDNAETNPFLYNLAGSKEIDKILSGELDAFDADFETADFEERREQYLLYD